MISFTLLKTSTRSRARLGILKTPHGEVETPSLVPVATQAAVKTLTSEEAVRTKTQILIANTFHLHLKPGENIVASGGGLHTFMHWPRPLMTDSGGFQVFSMGFGRDLGVGKILKYFSGRKHEVVKKGTQPTWVRITDAGVWFRSPIDGTKLFLGPKESMKIQEALGADIMFAFDECTPPTADHAYTQRSLERTHRWARMCLEAKRSKQALFGIVQGGRYKDLRIKSARCIGKLSFDGFGIGGELGGSKEQLVNILRWSFGELPEKKPRHLLGIGHPEDMPNIVKAGVDTFDCIAPTHYARHGVAFTARGRFDMTKVAFLKEKDPLDARCACEVCGTYTRSYIAHLVRAKEITGLRLLTFHNVFYFNTLVEKLRSAIKNGKL